MVNSRLWQQHKVLEPIREAKVHDHSYGFHPNRSQEHAIARVTNSMTEVMDSDQAGQTRTHLLQCYRMMQKQHLHFVVDIEIKGFFDNVNHSKLIRQMWARVIRDKRKSVRHVMKAQMFFDSLIGRY